MTVVLEEQQKPELEDVIAHYGVKGMRWGVRRTPEQLAKRQVRDNKVTDKAGNKLKGAERTARIKEARGNVKKQELAVQKAQIEKAQATTKKGRDAANEVLKREYKKYVNHPDLADSLAQTRGQKAAFALATGAVGLATGGAGAIAFLGGGAAVSKYMKTATDAERNAYNEFLEADAKARKAAKK